MARRRRRRRFSSPPEMHARAGAHAVTDAIHHAGMAVNEVRRGSCSSALRELLTAQGAAAEAKAHKDSGGPAPTSMSARAVAHAAEVFSKNCMR